jgi:hypothetical protein
MKGLAAVGAVLVVLCGSGLAGGQVAARRFSPERDLLSLHYDHAPDKDDGQSAAADRTILQALFGADWIKRHVVAVSGAHGKNGGEFDAGSDRVMDVVWNDCGGWLAGHGRHDEVVRELAGRWGAVLEAGGDVWVKEGGQSDITAKAVRLLRDRLPRVTPSSRVHVVQHSGWNEEQTTDAALDYTQQHTHYVRIRDANQYLNVKGGDQAFVAVATAHPVFGPGWKAAFAYYPPEERLDFSDTGELMHILGLGEMSIDAFRARFLAR